MTFKLPRSSSLLIAALLLAACSSDGESSTETESSTPEATTEITPTVSVPVADLEATHISGGATYPQSPGIGGPHYPFWQNCGFYDVPVIEGSAVHSLEHGAVWITYRDDLPAEQIDALRELSESNDRLLISPYDQAESLVLTAWGVQLRGDFAPTDAEVSSFIATYQDNPDLPEAGVSCESAAGEAPSNPRVLADGSQVPDEFQ